MLNPPSRAFHCWWPTFSTVIDSGLEAWCTGVAEKFSPGPRRSEGVRYAEAYGKQRIWGRVVQVGELLGPKTVRTDEPTERIDRKFLETLVELDAGAQLPAGLRVDAFVLADGVQTAAIRSQPSGANNAKGSDR